MQLVDPALLIALLGSLGIDFRRHADHSGDIASLWLSPRHTTQTGGDEEGHLVCRATVATYLTGSIEHGDSRAVDDALRADIHIRAGRHLAVLRHAEGVAPLPVIGLRVVGNHHTVGDHHTGCIGVRGEQS